MTEILLGGPQCIVTREELFHTRVHNVCTDTVSTIPWGFFDWASAGFTVAFYSLIAIGCWMFWRVWRRVHVS